MSRYRSIVHFLLLAALSLTGPVHAGVQISHVDPGLSLHCRQTGLHGLNCQFRLLNGGDASTVSLAVGDRPVSSSSYTRFPQQGDKTAIMLVIDLGPDMPLHIDRRLYQHLHQLLGRARSHHQIGLAAFGNKMQMIAPVGVPLAEIEADLASLRSGQPSSSLYGVIRETINMLSFHSAKRRAIILVSNGNSADDTHRHDEIINAARSKDVSIISLAYPGREGGPGLDTLRRLSEASGGWFLSFSEGNDMEQFADIAFQSLDSGGLLHIDLAQPEMANLQRGSSLLLSVHQENRRVHHAVLFLTPTAETVADPSLEYPPPAAGPRPSPPEQTIIASVERLGLMAYMVLGIGLLFIVGGVLLLMRRPKPAASMEVPAHGPGYLVHKTQSGEAPVKLDSELISIGRNADNDVQLQDSSVSRHHAHIQRRTDGNYTITDLDSLNGIYINNRQIKSSLLAEGDEVEIGDIRLRFTLHAPAINMLPPPGERPSL